MAQPVRALPPEAALDRLGAGFDTEAVGALAGRPVMVLDLDAGPVPPELTAILTRLPAVVVGVTRGRGALSTPPDLDVLLTDQAAPPPPWVGVPDVEAALDELERQVHRFTAAAIVLVQLLRLSESLSIADALVAESLAYSMLQAGQEHRRWLGERRQRQHGRHQRRRATLDPDPTVVVSRDGDVLSIELNRPHVHNAFSAAMRDDLTAALQLAAADRAITDVELSGAGPSFCSGGDLGEFGLTGEPDFAHLIRTTRSPAAWLAAVADRTTVHTHGACVGAGVELAAFAGRVLADPATTYRLPEVAMGLVPGSGGTVSLPRRIGRARAAYLAITGHAIDTATALTWGLVDEVRPREG